MLYHFQLKVSMPTCTLFLTVQFTRPSYFLYLAILLLNLQTPVDEYVGKDWRSINFRQDHAIHLNKNSYCVFMCQRANIGECPYAVCHVRHEEQSKTQKRTRGRVLSDNDLMETCHDELRNLQLCADIWWCTKDYLGFVRECSQWGKSKSFLCWFD